MSVNQKKEGAVSFEDIIQDFTFEVPGVQEEETIETTELDFSEQEQEKEVEQKQETLEVKVLDGLRKIDKLKDERAKVQARKLKFDIEIENLILVTGELEDGDTIRRIGDNEISIKNLNLFVNKAIDEEKVKLKIGVGLEDPEYNFKYIVDNSIA